MNTKLLIVSICIFVLTIFCGFDNYSDESQKNESIVKAFIESWNSHDINRLVSLFRNE